MTYEEAVAAVTAPGERYEAERIVVDGVELTAFKKPRNAAGKVLKRQLRDEVPSR